MLGLGGFTEAGGACATAAVLLVFQHQYRPGALFLRVNVDAVSGAARGDDDAVVAALQPAFDCRDPGAG